MSRTRRIALFAGITLVTVFSLLCGTTMVFARLPEQVSDQETLLLGQTRFVPGSQAALRVAVRNARDGSPIEDATVAVSLASAGAERPLFEGSTDDLGTAEISFQVPEDTAQEQTLVLQVRSHLGQDRIEQPITLERAYRVLLTTDKPIYQPGQTIHIRALALGAFDLRPAAEQEIVFIVADAKGNKVFRQTVPASEYGIAATDFTLASQVNTGRYTIGATLGDTTSERTVTVEHYVLPKFEVELSTDRDFYLPGEEVAGQVRATYFFGKPVDEGEVVISGSVFDVEREQVLELQGVTGEDGVFEFAFDLPPYFVSGLEAGVASFLLQATVTDGAQHTEQVNLSLPVAQQRIVIDAVPESGELKPGVENVLYIVAAYPDGSPAACQVEVLVDSERYTTRTGEYGLGELRFVPAGPQAELMLTARDAQGNEAASTLYLEGQWSSEYVLLRPEQAVATVGETLGIEVLTSSETGIVYLDLVREGQTVSTRALRVAGGRAQTAIDLSVSTTTTTRK